MSLLKRYPPKPIDRPDHISILVPTRGRPAWAQSMFQSYQETVARKDLFDVWLYVDDDDQVTIDYIDAGEWRSFGFSIHWHVAPAKNSMGEMINELWQSCSTNPGIYFPFCDDVAISTPGWDETLRKSYARFEDGYMLGFLIDLTAQPSQVIYAAPSARWLNTVGYYYTNRFHFWFVDNWLDDVSQMAERKVMIPIEVHAPQGKGKTPRMRNLPFWFGYYIAMLSERYQEACLILASIHGEGSPQFLAARERAKQTAARLAYKYNMIGLASQRETEAALRDFSKVPSPGQVASYLISEVQAVEEMLGLVRSAVDRGETRDLLELLETLEYSSFAVPDLQYLRGEALYRLGYRDEALASIDRELELRPDEPKGGMLRDRIVTGEGGPGSYYKERSALRTPSWLDLKDKRFLLFPEQVEPDLFFTLQRFLYLDPAIDSVLDIGAGSGEGSTRAVMEAAEYLPGVKVFCLEPDLEKFRALAARYGGRAELVHAASVPPERYVTGKELELFYNYLPSVMNSLPLEQFQLAREQEIDYLRQYGVQVDGIARIKREHRIERFGLVILDGSLFCGEADLQEVYGARYLALNYLKSIKNYGNLQRLMEGGDYQLIAANPDYGCGYAVLKHN